MLYVILEKARPYTRTRKGKLERVKGSPYREQSMKEMIEWYDRHKEELWGARKRKRGFQSMKETKKEREWVGKSNPGSEMAGMSGASFASGGGGTVGAENWPPQPLLNYSKKKSRKRKKGSIPAFQGGGSSWVMS